MASGRTHAKVAVTLLGCGVVTSFILAIRHSPYTPAAWSSCVGLLNGWLVTPDADIDHATREEKRWRSVPLIGGLLALLFGWFWYGYALSFTHRGVSHVWIIGTATRFAYQWTGIIFWTITFNALVLYFRGTVPFYVENILGVVPWWFLFWYFVGWCIQDTGHLIFDWRGWRKFKHLIRRVIPIAIVVGIFAIVFYFGFFAP